jgi:osmotically-inducible protein OsmY
MIRHPTKPRGSKSRLWASALLLVLVGCSEQEVAKIEKVTGKAWNKAEKSAKHVSVELGLDLEGATTKLEDLTLPRRVQQRLQWDGLLKGAEIKVQIDQDQIVLTGSVRDETQRQRAVQLAESTDGVRTVKDILQIQAGAP